MKNLIEQKTKKLEALILDWREDKTAPMKDLDTLRKLEKKEAGKLSFVDRINLEKRLEKGFLSDKTNEDKELSEKIIGKQNQRA